MLQYGIFSWDIEAIAKSLRLTKDEVRQYFTDGRRVSFLLERRFAREVVGGKLAESEGASYDLLDLNGDKWEVRSISSDGIYFCPSYMVGSGRKFDEDGFLRKLADVKGYLISRYIKISRSSVVGGACTYRPGLVDISKAWHDN